MEDEDDRIDDGTECAECGEQASEIEDGVPLCPACLLAIIGDELGDLED